MSDGGKGSSRRNEDNEAYRNNFDNIFRKKPMIDEDYIEDEPEICPRCNGSGEGMYDGSRCGYCKGTGEVQAEKDFDDGFLDCDDDDTGY